LEWLFRLGREPRRLAGRYLVEPWFILRLFVAELGTRRAA
jgi:N-acetylglucosaminyldiphosphoundecaprenol N-acetyl-beta-D-mannosaminyltransferase